MVTPSVERPFLYGSEGVGAVRLRVSLAFSSEPFACPVLVWEAVLPLRAQALGGEGQLQCGLGAGTGSRSEARAMVASQHRGVGQVGGGSEHIGGRGQEAEGVRMGGPAGGDSLEGGRAQLKPLTPGA